MRPWQGTALLVIIGIMLLVLPPVAIAPLGPGLLIVGYILARSRDPQIRAYADTAVLGGLAITLLMACLIVLTLVGAMGRPR